MCRFEVTDRPNCKTDALSVAFVDRDSVNPNNLLVLINQGTPTVPRLIAAFVCSKRPCLPEIIPLVTVFASNGSIGFPTATTESPTPTLSTLANRPMI